MGQRQWVKGCRVYFHFIIKCAKCISRMRALLAASELLKWNYLIKTFPFPWNPWLALCVFVSLVTDWIQLFSFEFISLNSEVGPLGVAFSSMFVSFTWPLFIFFVNSLKYFFSVYVYRSGELCLRLQWHLVVISKDLPLLGQLVCVVCVASQSLQTGRRYRPSGTSNGGECQGHIVHRRNSLGHQNPF